MSINRSKSLLSSLIFVILLSSFVSCDKKKTTVAYRRPDNLKECIEYINQNYMTPEEFVLEKFKEHDVVILGEWHRIQHDPVLVQRLIPDLYENGIYTVATEFALYKDQALIDQLTTAYEYDESLANEINLNALLSIGLGGYQEYVDIFRAAWELNSRLPEGTKKFRILGLNDLNDWSYMKTKEDRNNPVIRQKVFQNFSEKNWSDRLKKEVLSKGEKALCYVGIHHAFTKYHQPNVSDGKFNRHVTDRFGNFVYEEIGDRAFTIALHSPWISAHGYDKEAVFPADGMIDYLLAYLPKEKQLFAFDTDTSPMGFFSGETSIYKFGYENFSLRDFCDGYICQGKFTEYKPVTYIEDFVNKENLSYVQSYFPNPFFRNSTSEQFNKSGKWDAYMSNQNIQNLNKLYKEIYQKK